MKIFSYASAGLIIAATSALAESGLTPLPAPEARPYPYRILDLQPGDPLEDVLARFAERSETPPTGETGTMRVQSPTGGSFEFSFETYKRIGDTGMYARMAGEPQDATTAMLSTEVMEQRPLSLSRIIEQPSGELPQLLELKAQIEKLYGPPSKSEIDSYSMTLTYGWGEAGFIQDLDAQEPMSFEVPRAGRTRFIDDYRPCLGHSAVDSRITPDFRHPRERDLMPGCVAVYRVRFTGEAGRTRIEFGLTDFELGRMHREELDRQIMAKIDGTAATPSDLDL